MATTKNIIMKQFNGTDYDTLYPKTNVEQVENLTPSSIGAVAKTGDTMTGNLSITGASYPKLFIKDTTNGSMGQIQCFNHLLQIIATEAGSTSNSRQIMLSDKVNKSSLSDALRLAETKDGVSTYYNILHTGNLENLRVARISIGSYVGTGTYGADNPSSLTFDFVPKAVFMIGTKDSNGVHQAYMFGWDSGGNGFKQRNAMYYDLLTTSYVEGVGFGRPYDSSRKDFGKRSDDGKTFSWYSDYSSSYQFNDAGTTFYYMALY